MNHNPEKGLWSIFQNGQETLLDGKSYLQYLLNEAEDAMRSFNKRKIAYLIWDFEEIKELNSLLYASHKITIDQNIKSLSRLCNPNIETMVELRNSARSKKAAKRYFDSMRKSLEESSSSNTNFDS